MTGGVCMCACVCGCAQRGGNGSCWPSEEAKSIHNAFMFAAIAVIFLAQGLLLVQAVSEPKQLAILAPLSGKI